MCDRCGRAPRCSSTSFRAKMSSHLSPACANGGSCGSLSPAELNKPMRRRFRMSILEFLDAPIAFPRMFSQLEVLFGPAPSSLHVVKLECCAGSGSGAPETKTSRKARLYSANFHSPRNPSVPILNDRTGGTLLAVAKREAACRIVPSPPSVDVRSTLSW